LVKKLLISLLIFSITFFSFNIYIYFVIKRSTDELGSLINLHQVEILREHLLIHAMTAQSYLQSSRHDLLKKEIDALSKNVDQCFSCHHTTRVKSILSNLRTDFKIYSDVAKRYISTGSESIRKDAFKKGDRMVKSINEIVSIATSHVYKKTDIAMKKIKRTQDILFTILVLWPAFISFISLFIIRAFTKPVKSLLIATRSLKNGDLDYRVEGLKDEFAEVGRSFNEMASSLKAQMLNMQRTEQLRVCGEVATGLVHEIKNPLAGIKIAIEALKEESDISEETKDILSKVVREIKRIESLLKGLLDFARPSALHFVPTDINRIIDIALMFSVEKSQNIKVIRDLDESLPPVMADQQKLQQVFLNLIFNAVDAMHGKGTLSIKTSHKPSDRSVIIEVSDTGDGIRKEVIDNIFKPFFTTKPKGTGLGLAITKMIIEQHGGSIGVESFPGRGTTFTISLPCNVTKGVTTIERG
jgi:signal transduction histidine kinase